MTPLRTPFYHYICQHKSYLFTALVVGVAYTLLVRWLLPLPSFFSDSYTYIKAAAFNQPVSFRPILYSKILRLLAWFPHPDAVVVAAQYASNLLANLLLFYTVSYHFELSKKYRLLIFALLIVYPLYVFYSVYISSDAFFNALAVVWFTGLIWLMNKPKGYVIWIHSILLGLLFLLRYNAIYFPCISAIAIFYSHFTSIKKWLYASGSFLVVAIIMLVVTEVNQRYTGTKIFSAFSGWQMANNALHIVRHERADPLQWDDPQLQQLGTYINQYFDTANPGLFTNGVSGGYMWAPDSPLKQWAQQHKDAKRAYFRVWNQVAPLYHQYGKTVIIQNPVGYIRYFVLPNTKEYLLPQLEIYEAYMQNDDTIAATATKFFNISNNKTPQVNQRLYHWMWKPWKIGFGMLNVLIIAFGLWYLRSQKRRNKAGWMNRIIILFYALFILNGCFIVWLAPSVLRYHLFIITISFAIVPAGIAVLRKRITEKIFAG